MKRRLFFGALASLVATARVAAQALPIPVPETLRGSKAIATPITTVFKSPMSDWSEQEKKWKGTFLISARLPGRRAYKDYVFTGRMPMIMRFSSRYVKNVNTGEVIKQYKNDSYVPDLAKAEHIDRAWLADNGLIIDTRHWGKTT